MAKYQRLIWTWEHHKVVCWVHFYISVYINSLSTAVTKSELILYAGDALLVFDALAPQILNNALRHDFEPNLRLVYRQQINTSCKED